MKRYVHLNLRLLRGWERSGLNSKLCTIGPKWKSVTTDRRPCFWTEHYWLTLSSSSSKNKNKNRQRTEWTKLTELQHQSTKVAVCADKSETGTAVAGPTAHVLQFLFQITKLCGPRKMFRFHFQFKFYIFHSPFSHKIHQRTPPSGGGRKSDKESTLYRIQCVHHDTNRFFVRLSRVHCTFGFVSQPCKFDTLHCKNWSCYLTS